MVLEVGQVTETVTVEAAAATLQTDRAEVRGELTEKTLKNVLGESKMKNKTRWAVATAALGAVLAISGSISASQHFESALSQAGPAFDLTDVYVFPSERSGYTVFIANVNPHVEPGSASPFDDSALYSLHIGEDQALSKGMTLTFQFTGSKGRVGLVSGANEGVGPRGSAKGRQTHDRHAGRRDDAAKRQDHL